MRSIILSICLATFLTAYSQETDKNKISDTYGSGENVVINFYQNYISDINGHTCQMYPSCSQYAKQAFNTHNSAKAFTLTASRLNRCGNDLKDFNTIEVDGRILFHDPLTDEVAIKTAPVYNQIEKPDSIKCFGDFLFEIKQFESAIVQYYKHIYENLNPTLNQYFLTQIAKCHYQLHDTDNLRALYLSTFDTLQIDNRNSIAIRLSKLYYKDQLFSSATTVLSTMVQPYSIYEDDYYLLVGLIALENADYNQSKTAFGKISPDAEYSNKLTPLLSFETSVYELPRRSPFVAGLLSTIIPGSGYLMSNKPETALSSLIVNGLFGWLAYEAFHNENYALGTAVTIFGTGWYIGNISGSAKSVVKWNNHQYLDLKEKSFETIIIN